MRKRTQEGFSLEGDHGLCQAAAALAFDAIKKAAGDGCPATHCSPSSPKRQRQHRRSSSSSALRSMCALATQCHERGQLDDALALYEAVFAGCIKLERRRATAERLATRELVGRRIAVEGMGSGTVLGPFRRGSFLRRWGPSYHLVQFEARGGRGCGGGARERVKLRRHGNGGLPFVLLDGDAAAAEEEVAAV